MKKNRMVVSVVLTAGLGLTGVVSASASSAATPASAKNAGPARNVRTQAKSQAQAITTQKGGGPIVVCVVNTKPGQTLPVPLPGKTLPVPPPGTAGKPGKTPGMVTVKVVNGKIYVNGKEVKGKPGAKCPLPPLPGKPGKPGKGLVCLTVIEKGKPGHKPGKTTVKSVNGKVYINGKLVPNSKVDKQCPILPPFPGPGKGGVVLKPGQSGTSASGVNGPTNTVSSGSEASLTTVAG